MARRAIVIGAAVGLALSLLAWGANLRLVTWRNPRTLTGVFGLWNGLVVVTNGGSSTRGGWQVGPAGGFVRWWPDDGEFISGT